jgi:paraquat-inducible protein B
MSKPANKTVIGFFVIGAAALVVVAILILGSGKFFRQTFKAVCYFEGSVGGLNIGAPVVFRGVKIGSVTDVVLRYDTKGLVFKIPVYIEIEPNKMVVMGPVPTMGQNIKALIDNGLRAQLEMQSFVTGQLQVGLDFHPDKPAKLVGSEKGYPEIPTVPTPLQEIVKKIQELPIDEIILSVRSALKGIDNLVNSRELTGILNSIEAASQDLRGLMKNVNDQVSPLTVRANDTMADVQKLVRNTDVQVTALSSTVQDMVKDAQKHVGALSAGAGDTMKDARGLIQTVQGEVKPLSSNIQSLLQTVEGEVKPLSSNIQVTLGDARGLMKSVDGKVEQTANNAEVTLKEVQELVKTARKQVEIVATSLDEKMRDVQKLVRNVDGRVDEIAPALEKTLQAATDALGEAQTTLRAVGDSPGGGSPLIYDLTQTLEDFSRMARSIRYVFDYLERHPESLVRGKR